MNGAGIFLPSLVAATVRTTVLLAAACMVAGLLRHASAAQKHFIWVIAALSALLAPLLAALIPLPFTETLSAPAARWVAEAVPATHAALSPASAAASRAPTPFYADPYVLILIVWVVGFLLLASRLAAGLMRLRGISKNSRPARDAAWTVAAEKLCKSMRIRRPVRILEPREPAPVPFTYGALRPRIVLASQAAHWSEGRRRVALLHELAHVARHDWLLQICGEVLCCAYWFHPLAWLAARRLRREADRACDDIVLNSGVPAADYARDLLSLARPLRNSSPRWAAALAIVSPSNLERRLKAMLTDSVNRAGLSRRAKLAVAAAALGVLLPLAALRLPAEMRSGSRAGTPRGWILAGTNPKGYLTGLEARCTHAELPCAFLKAKKPSTKGFGTLMQQFSATRYRGQRVRLSGWVRSQRVTGWAGLWMRVDRGSTALVMDNMHDRPIRGTRAWQKYDVVLDVPSDATGISFGILLEKSGAVWLTGVKFEVVGKDVPSTAPAYETLPKAPANLNFEQ